MRKNKFIDLELGAKLKKFTLYFSVFAITFGVVSAILNTGGTYAVENSVCPPDWTYEEGVTFDNSIFVNKCKSPKTYNGYAECISAMQNEFGLTFEQGGMIADGNFCVLETLAPVSARAYMDPEVALSDLNCYYCASSSTVVLYNGKPTTSCLSGTWSEQTQITNLGNCAMRTVNYVLDGGDMSQHNKITIPHGTMITLPTPEKDGMSFKEWQYVESNISGGSSTINYGAEAKVTITKNMTFTAVWDASGSSNPDNPDEQKQYSVTFYNNGGTWANDITDADSDHPSRTVEYADKYYFTNSEIAVNPPSGKKLCGWITDEGNGTTLTEYADANDDKDILWAKWCDDSGSNPGSGDTPDVPNPPTGGEEYTATFNLNGGTLNGSTANVTDSCTVASGDTACRIDFPREPQKSNNDFTGWSRNSSCSVVSNSNYVLIDEDVTYYACYKDNTPVDPGDTPSGGDDNPDINENPNTGNWLLYVAYLVGALALGYTGYYSYKMVKTKNND